MDPAAPAHLFQEAVRDLPLAAAVFDTELRFLAHNADWARLHDEPAERSFVGRRLYEVVPTIPERWRAVHARCLAGATERSDDDVLVLPSGRDNHVRWVVAPWRDAGGAIGGLIVYVDDTTAVAETRRRLEERESLIRQLFERSPIGLNLCRMDGLWLESNPAFLDIIGYTQEEADGGLTYWQLTPRRYDADEAEQLAKLRASKRYGPYEKEFVRKDGRLVPVRLNGFIVERDGAEFIWSLIEDLTQQRALEAKVQDERLKAIHASKLAMVGEMAAGIAHEINNPLAIIGGFAYTLRSAIDRGDAADIDEALKAIEEATERAGKIVHGLRKFARQRGQDAPEELSVADIVEDALDLCRTRTRAHGVEVSADLRPTPKVRGHAIELSQVLVNLLNNAFDAARAAPQKWIRVGAEADAEPGWVRISVTDSGPPIPPEVADKLFQPFFTTKAVGEGTGLGLSISRTIVESHGGTLALLAGAPNTTFVVRLRASA
jgi:PAS domain S-box-containing protein